MFSWELIMILYLTFVSVLVVKRMMVEDDPDIRKHPIIIIGLLFTYILIEFMLFFHN